MDVSTKQYKRCDVVKATGRIDSYTSPQLEEVLNALTAANHLDIILDMSEVEFLSSAGLRVLINVQKTCRRWNRGELALLSVPQRIQEALELAGVVPLFTFFDDIVEAVGSF